MEFCVTIPDTEAARIAAAVCAQDGYAPPDAQAAVQHTQAHVFRYLARIVVEQEAAQAAAQAADGVRTNPNDPLAQWLYPPAPPTPEPGPVGPVGPSGPVGPVVGETGATGVAMRRVTA